MTTNLIAKRMQNIYKCKTDKCIKGKHIMSECETMAKIVCKASDLKCDSYKFKGQSFLSKSCSLCEHTAYENAEHVIMSCPYNTDLRTAMCNELSTMRECRDIWNVIPNTCTLKVILGGTPDNMEFSSLIPVWCTAAKWVHKMYLRTVNERSGVG